MTGRSWLVLAFVFLGFAALFLATYLQGQKSESEWRWVCYPFMIEARVEIEGDKYALCANGERKKLK